MRHLEFALENVLSRTDLKPTSKVALAAILLLIHEDEDGICRWGIRVIGKRSGLSHKTVSRALAELEGAGIIRFHPDPDLAARRSITVAKHVAGTGLELEPPPVPAPLDLSGVNCFRPLIVPSNN
jgi:DNA-binding MarR family transcriptional regulator